MLHSASTVGGVAAASSSSSRPAATLQVDENNSDYNILSPAGNQQQQHNQQDQQDQDPRDWHNVPDVVRDAITILEQEQTVHTEAITHIAKQVRTVKQMHKKCCHTTTTSSSRSREASQEPTASNKNNKRSSSAALDDRTNRNLFPVSATTSNINNNSSTKNLVESSSTASNHQVRIMKEELESTTSQTRKQMHTLESSLKHFQMQLSSVNSNIDQLQDQARRPTIVNESDIRHVVGIMLGERAVEQRQRHFDATVAVLCALLDEDDCAAKLAQIQVPAASARDANQQIHFFINQIVRKIIATQKKEADEKEAGTKNNNSKEEAEKLLAAQQQQKEDQIIGFIDNSTESTQRLYKEVETLRSRQKQLEVQLEQQDIEMKQQKQSREEQMEERIFAKIKKEFSENLNMNNLRVSEVENSLEASDEKLRREANRLEAKILQIKEINQQNLQTASSDITDSLQQQTQLMLNKTMTNINKSLADQKQLDQRELSSTLAKHEQNFSHQIKQRVEAEVQPVFESYRRQMNQLQTDVAQLRLNLTEQTTNFQKSQAETTQFVNEATSPDRVASVVAQQRQRELHEESQQTSTAVNSLRNMVYEMQNRLENFSNEIDVHKTQLTNAFVTQSYQQQQQVTSSNPSTPPRSVNTSPQKQRPAAVSAAARGGQLVSNNNNPPLVSSNHSTPNSKQQQQEQQQLYPNINIYNSPSPDTNASTATPPRSSQADHHHQRYQQQHQQTSEELKQLQQTTRDQSSTIKTLEKSLDQLQALTAKLQSSLSEQETKAEGLSRKLFESQTLQNVETNQLKEQVSNLKSKIQDDFQNLKESLNNTRETLASNNQQQIAKTSQDHQSALQTQREEVQRSIDNSSKTLQQSIEAIQKEQKESLDKMQKQIQDELDERAEKQDREISSFAGKISAVEKAALETKIELMKSVEAVTGAVRSDFESFKNRTEDSLITTSTSLKKLVQEEGEQRKDQVQHLETKIKREQDEVINKVEKENSEKLEACEKQSLAEVRSSEERLQASLQQISERVATHLVDQRNQTDAQFKLLNEKTAEKIAAVEEEISKQTKQQLESSHSSSLELLSLTARISELEENLSKLLSWSEQVEERNETFSVQYNELESATIRHTERLETEMDSKANEVEDQLKEAVAEISERISSIEVIVQGHHNHFANVGGDQNHHHQHRRSWSDGSTNSSFVTFQQQQQAQQQTQQQTAHHQRSSSSVGDQQQQQQNAGPALPLAPSTPTTTFNNSTELRDCQRRLQLIQEQVTQISQHQTQLENAQVALEDTCYKIARDTAETTAEKSVARIRHQEQQQQQGDDSSSSHHQHRPTSPLQQHEALKKEREEAVSQVTENVENIRKIAQVIATDHVCRNKLMTELITADSVSPALSQISSSSVPSWVAQIASQKFQDLWSDRSVWLEKRLKEQIRSEWEPAVASAVLEWRIEVDEKMRHVEATSAANASTAAAQAVAAVNRHLSTSSQQQQQASNNTHHQSNNNNGVQIVEIPSQRLMEVEDSLRATRDRLDAEVASIRSAVTKNRDELFDVKEKILSENHEEKEKFFKSFATKDFVEQNVSKQNETLEKHLAEVQNDFKNEIQSSLKQQQQTTNAVVSSLAEKIDELSGELENQKSNQDTFDKTVGDQFQSIDSVLDEVKLSFSKSSEMQRERILNAVERRCSTVEQNMMEENKALAEDMVTLRGRFEKLSVEFVESLTEIEQAQVIFKEQQKEASAMVTDAATLITSVKTGKYSSSSSSAQQQQGRLPSADESIVMNNNQSGTNHQNNNNSSSKLMMNISSSSAVTFLPAHPSSEEALMQQLHDSIVAEVQIHVDRLLIQQLSKKANADDVVQKDNIRELILDVVQKIVKPVLTGPVDKEVDALWKEFRRVYESIDKVEADVSRVNREVQQQQQSSNKSHINARMMTATSLSKIQQEYASDYDQSDDQQRQSNTTNNRQQQQQQRQNSNNHVNNHHHGRGTTTSENDSDNNNSSAFLTDDVDIMNNPPQMSSVEGSLEEIDSSIGTNEQRQLLTTSSAENNTATGDRMSFQRRQILTKQLQQRQRERRSHNNNDSSFSNDDEEALYQQQQQNQDQRPPLAPSTTKNSRPSGGHHQPPTRSINLDDE